MKKYRLTAKGEGIDYFSHEHKSHFVAYISGKIDDPLYVNSFTWAKFPGPLTTVLYDSQHRGVSRKDYREKLLSLFQGYGYIVPDEPIDESRIWD